jgi:HTH-type transcriptional regulator/antitoxin HigA
VADHPGKFLRELLESKGWTQDELAAVTGYSRQTVNGLASGKSRVTPEMAVTLAAAFGNTADQWLRWDVEHQLGLIDADRPNTVERRARMYDVAPIHDMQRRGWIRETSTVEELEAELSRFFGGDVAAGINFPVATHRSDPLSGLNSAEKAWCFRARQLARAVHVAEFSAARMPAALKKLRQIAAFPKEARRLPETLAYYGIRFVVVEPIPNAKIDGASFWVDENPVIAVSVRWDRIDAFWFVVFHEFFHIHNNDVFSVDVNLVREEEKGLITVSVASEAAEKAASDQAADALVPKDELESFIQRISPLFSATKIIQFANRVQMHPGVIVGQLQHRRQIGYSSHRDFLVKVRGVVTETALTDGWGHRVQAGFTA